jgi:hypothetical protein
MLVSARPRVFPRGLAVRIADLLPHRPEKRSDCVSYFNAGNAPLRVPM